MAKSLGEQLIARVERSGDTSREMFLHVSELISIAMNEARAWTNRTDDAVRIPDMLFDAVRELRDRAQAAEAAKGGDA